MQDDRRLVYSTDGSVRLPESAPRKPVRPKTALPPNDGVVRVGCERRQSGRMTLIYGLAAAEVEAIARDLKRRCGSGGAVKDGVLELQGDQRDAVLSFFSERGRRTKRMGG